MFGSALAGQGLGRFICVRSATCCNLISVVAYFRQRRPFGRYLIKLSCNSTEAKLLGLGVWADCWDPPKHRSMAEAPNAFGTYQLKFIRPRPLTQGLTALHLLAVEMSDSPGAHTPIGRVKSQPWRWGSGFRVQALCLGSLDKAKTRSQEVRPSLWIVVLAWVLSLVRCAV